MALDSDLCFCVSLQIILDITNMSYRLTVYIISTAAMQFGTVSTSAIGLPTFNAFQKNYNILQPYRL